MATRIVSAVLPAVMLLAAPPARADLYVANSASNNVYVSTTGTDCSFFTGNVAVGTRPVGVAVSPDGTRAYVTNMGDGSVSVIDTTRPLVIGTIQVGGSPTGPVGAAVHPDGSRVYVVSNNRVAVINTATLTVTATVFVPGVVNDVAVHPDGTRVYVATTAGLVGVINTATNTASAFVPVGTLLFGVAVHPDGTRVYATDVGGFVGVIDAATNSVVATIPVAGVPSKLGVHPDGSRLFVANNMNQGGVAFPGKLTLIDTATNAVTFVQEVGRHPHSVAIDRSQVYVTNSVDATVTVLDASNGAHVGLMEVGSIPAGVATFLNPLPPPLPANVRVTSTEVTQGVQDVANRVLLVSGRRTFVRVHVRTDGPPVFGVTARLFGVAEHCTGSSCESIQLGSLIPVNSIGPWLTVTNNPRRSNIDDSFLFELPWAWTEGDPLRLYAVLHAGPGSPPATCRPNAPRTTHVFDPPANLGIQFIRLAYSLFGQVWEASVNEQQQSESWMRRAFPLAKLTSGPDWQVFLPGLGARVDRSDEECQDMAAGERSLCAHRYVMAKLGRANVLSGIAGGAHGAYGLIPQTSINTCMAPPGGQSPCFTRGACCTNRLGAGPSNNNLYAAHEIGHLLGRQHPVPGANNAPCAHDAKDVAYPYPFSLAHPLPYDSATGLAGFDGGDSSFTPAIPRTFLGSLNAPYDIMGYCQTWISDYTYRAIHGALRSSFSHVGLTSSKSDGGSGTATAQAGDWLTVFGSTTPGLTTPAYIDTLRVDRVFEVPPRTPGSHSIRLIGAGGQTLADYPFTPDTLDDAAPVGGGVAPLAFGQVVAFVAGTSSIQIVDVSAGNRVLGVRTVSANPPSIGDVALHGAPDPATGVATLGWSASDPDGDPLAFDVFFTRDGGASVLPLMMGASGSSVEIPTAGLGGGLVQFRVMATDGVHTAVADTAPFSLANKPPRPRILNPGAGTVTHVGQLVNLEGSATDPQDGVVPDTGLEWSIPGRSLGSGLRLSVIDLPAGIHEIALTATNSLGLSETTRVMVVVKEDAGPLGPTLTAGPPRIDWHVAAGDSELQSSELDIGNAGGGSLEFAAESSAPWLTLSAAGGNAPASLILTADPAGFGDGTTAKATVTVSAVGMAGQAITVPVTLSIGNTFVVGQTSPEPADQCPDDPDKTQPGACGCGIPDSQAGQACTTGQPGVCGAGLTVCGGGSAACVQTQQPSPEICDGLDNDCDGTTDDGNPGGGTSCTTGLPGICAAGAQICADGALACHQTTQPGVEICGNGIDEDCDGADLACPPPPPPVDACTPSAVLDNFNRPDGGVGGDWRGLTSTSFYRIAGHRLDARLGGPLYWNRASFGTNQAAFVTLSSVAPTGPSQGLLLKVQGGSVPDAGAIAVVYDAVARAVRVSTLRLGAHAWTPYAHKSVRFDGGDKLGACSTADGEMRVYKNDALVHTLTLTAADQAFFNRKGGKVGVWSLLAPRASFDDFGGATVTLP